MSSASQRTTQISPRESTDVEQVVQALSNGLRSDVEIAKTTRLSLDRVQIALVFLVIHKCVVGSPASRFRLTDNGYDMVKVANAAERNREALSAYPANGPRQRTSSHSCLAGEQRFMSLPGVGRRPRPVPSD